MALFDKFKNVADIAKSAAKQVASAAEDALNKGVSAAEDALNKGKSVVEDALNKNTAANEAKKEQEKQEQQARMEAIRKASAAHKAQVEKEQAEAAEAKRIQAEKEEAERNAELARRKEQRKTYVPGISAPACESGNGVCFTYANKTYCSCCKGEEYEELLYPESIEYALRLYAIENKLTGSDCDSYEEVTQEFLEAFMPAYADGAARFVDGVKKWGVGKSNPQLRLFSCLPNRHPAMTDEHLGGILRGLVAPPQDPEDAEFYFEKLVAILRKRRTYDRDGSKMYGAMLVMGLYYHRPMREYLFATGEYCSPKEEDLFDEYGHLKDTGLDFHSASDDTSLFGVMERWVHLSEKLMGRKCEKCGACVHWRGERESWYALHAVKIEPETKAVCSYYTIPELNKPAITAAEDTCANFEPCDVCDSL